MTLLLILCHTVKMIRPDAVTNFNRSVPELQEFLLFCITVHGKRAHVQALKLEHLLQYLSAITGSMYPFTMIDIARNMEDEETGETLLLKGLKKFKLGQYTRLCRSIDDLLLLCDLRTVGVKELENCFGVGPKTARFFLVHSRPNQEFAILDTHILKWLKTKGYEKIPKSTPQRKWYSHFERIFLTLVKKSGLTTAEFDLSIWKSFAL